MPCLDGSRYDHAGASHPLRPTLAAEAGLVGSIGRREIVWLAMSGVGWGGKGGRVGQQESLRVWWWRQSGRPAQAGSLPELRQCAVCHQQWCVLTCAAAACCELPAVVPLWAFIWACWCCGPATVAGGWPWTGGGPLGIIPMACGHVWGVAARLFVLVLLVLVLDTSPASTLEGDAALVACWWHCHRAARHCIGGRR